MLWETLGTFASLGLGGGFFPRSVWDHVFNGTLAFMFTKCFW